MSTTSSPVRQSRPAGQLLPSASREQIRAESATGWSPLRIQKKPGSDSPAPPQNPTTHTPSPLAKAAPSPSPNMLTVVSRPEGEETYRRSSSSYKHLKTNSLVSNSPFKSLGSDNNTPPPPLPPLAKRSAAMRAAGLGVASSLPGSPRGLPSHRMQGGGGGQNTFSSSSLPRPSPRKSSADRRKNEENMDPLGGPAVVVVVPGEEENHEVDEGAKGEGLPSGEEEAIEAIEKRREELKKDASVANSPFLTSLSSSELKESAVASSPSPLTRATVPEGSYDEQDHHEADEEEQAEYGAPLEPLPPTLYPVSPLESLSSGLCTSEASSPSSSIPSPPASPSMDVRQLATPSRQPSTPSRPTHLLQAHPVSPSPKSSLKSRRLKGPRESSGGVAGSGARPRRKTVTFREGAEVSVFERGDQEDQDNAISSDSGGDEYGQPSEDEEEGSFDLEHRNQHPQHQQQLGGYSDDEDEDYPNASATADFVDSLVEGDLFSPGSVSSPTFESQSSMMGSLHFSSSPLLDADPFGNPSLLRHHHHQAFHVEPPHSELPHPQENEHEIGLNEEVEVEERVGEVKARQEGPLHDPFLPPVASPMKSMGGLGLGRPSTEVPRKRMEPEIEEQPVEEASEDEEEQYEGDSRVSEGFSLPDEGDSAVLEELDDVMEEEGFSLMQEGEGEGEDLRVEDEKPSFVDEEEEDEPSFFEKEQTSEEITLINGELADHPLMGSRGLRLPVEQLETPERQQTPPSALLALPGAKTDSPWRLDIPTTSTSPLFNLNDLPETSPAILQQEMFSAIPPIITAQFQPSISEQSLASSSAGEFGTYKPSSSLERHRADDGEESGSGRGSPRITQESIRKRMLEKQRKEDEEAKAKQQQQQPSSATSNEWKLIEGLGIAMPSGIPIKTRPTHHQGLSNLEEASQRPNSPRPVSPDKAHLDKDLPPPPSSHGMSRPKAASIDFLPASIQTQPIADRPTLRDRTSTRSAHNILASTSALDKIALGAVATAAPTPTAQPTEVVKHSGSEKEVMVHHNQQSLNLEREHPSCSSPVEEAPPPHPELAFGAAHALAPIPSTFLSNKNQKERESMPPPPVPQQGTTTSGGTKEREEPVLETRRAKREGSGVGRPKGRGRRSLSTGDASKDGLMSSAAQSSKRRTMLETGSRPQSSLNDVSVGVNSTRFGSELISELDRIQDSRKRQYKLNEREQVYIASDEKVSHDKKAGDLHRGKAWRSVKRPSDMNEYAEEIREIRLREKPGKAHAKVFVKIIGITDIDVPVPETNTAFQIVLNNGLHSVETQSYKFGKEVEIGQEFELLGLENLEFSLAIKVRKDQNIASRLRSLTPRPAAAPSIMAPSVAPSTPTKTSAFRKLISSPRKAKPSPVSAAPAARPAAALEPIKDDLVRYLDSVGQLAVVKVVFKDIAQRCNGHILNLSLPLTGRWSSDAVNSDAAARSPASAKRSRQIGRLQLQIIMIDQIPGVPNEKLPQSLDDAVTGLRHVRWHKMDYFSGILTQLGGDCSSWRRRQMRIVGGSLEATSDVTGKITARIDLSKMVAIRDDNVESNAYDDESVERSFTLVFTNGDEIQFYADKDKDKEDWLHHLRELLGRVPSLPLWAELLWVRQHQGEASPVTA